MHYLLSRPKDGYCYLDFLDHWLFDALMQQNVERAGRYAREIGHWALLMHPELAPLPHNVILGED